MCEKGKLSLGSLMVIIVLTTSHILEILDTPTNNALGVA